MTNITMIYDFDGTLTPYSLPQYDILKQLNCSDEIMIKKVKEKIQNKQATSLYDAYYKCYKDILDENNIEMTNENVCLGADKVHLNKGVIEYFDNFQNSKTGIKHYIVTSGIKDYVDETVINKYVDGVYGVTYIKEGNKYKDIDYLLTDEEKVNIIKIIKNNNDENMIIYFGDGLTDKDAFEYVHSIGGKNVFIAANEQAKQVYQQLNVSGIIDECFEADFSLDSPIYNYINNIINQKTNTK